jgi:hypothetical protein
VDRNTSHNCLTGSKAPQHVASNVMPEVLAVAENCLVAAADPVYRVLYFLE